MDAKTYFEWVLAIIKSCTTSVQLEGAEKVVQFYKKHFGENEYSEQLFIAIVDQDSMFVIPPIPSYIQSGKE